MFAFICALARVAVTATFLFVPVALAGLAIFSRTALPAETNQAAKADLVPIPQPKPVQCQYSFAQLQKEVPGWKVIPKAVNAIRYMMASGINEGPALDSAAYKVFGDKVAVVGLFRGCVVMRLLAEKKKHDDAITKALGLVV